MIRVDSSPIITSFILMSKGIYPEKSAPVDDIQTHLYLQIISNIFSLATGVIAFVRKTKIDTRRACFVLKTLLSFFRRSQAKFIDINLSSYFIPAIADFMPVLRSTLNAQEYFP